MASSEFPRQFIAENAELSEWSNVEPYFEQLTTREIDTPEQLEKWLVDYSELMAWLSEVGTDRYVNMTCHTDNEEFKVAYLEFVTEIEPKSKPLCHELNVRYTECPAAKQLPKDRYAVLDRSIRAEVALFRPENVALEVEEAKLEQKYQEISGSQMVNFDGKEQTLQQLGLYAESTDRDMRRQAWEAEAQRRLQDAEALDEIFDEMIKLRHQIAINAGCSDYREYAFKAKQRFDYTPEDCIAFHEAVKEAAVPVFRDMQRQRKKDLGVDTLRPWDLSVDVKGRMPLRPFDSVDDLLSKTSKVFHRIDPELGAKFDEMNHKGYLDLDSRKGKAPGGYQSTYEESRRPFIFMNAVGLQRDVMTLLHEGGHAFHQYEARHDPLLAYRSSPIEFAEVASFTMELIGMGHLDEFYDAEEFSRAQREKLESIAWLFCWVATVDAFQHWLYTNPTHTRDERREHWLSLLDQFGGVADYTGHEEARAMGWQRQLHLFQVPFYYIEYGIAKLGALQVWRNAMADTKDAISKYRSALALGGSRPLPELFEQAGASFDFSHKTVGPLLELVQQQLAKYSE